LSKSYLISKRRKKENTKIQHNIEGQYNFEKKKLLLNPSKNIKLFSIEINGTKMIYRATQKMKG